MVTKAGLIEDMKARTQLVRPGGRVLHVIENFDGQAIERWLIYMMAAMGSLGRPVEWSFYSTLGQPGRMDGVVRDMGGKIIYSPVPLRQTWKFVKELRDSISEGGYDILHCHHDILSAVYLLAAAGLPLKKRIVHVHNTSLGLPTPSPLKNALLRGPMRLATLGWADNIVGVSDAALDAFLRGRGRKPGRDLVIHCGIETAAFHRQPPAREGFRQSLGLSVNSRVLLFVGRMTDYKNPLFVLDVLAHLSQANPCICAVFAGVGPLEDEVRKKARQNSLGDRVRVLGWQEDIPALMQTCDMLIWSGLEEPKEGLGLGVVEAQAAGLPVLMSRSVPEDAIVVPELVSVLPLAAGAQVWAEKVISILGKENTARDSSLSKVESSAFSIANSAANIMALYEA